jgi:GH25 family lysozyme M1 (1,4-beta-N-acetylmuramidase)
VFFRNSVRRRVLAAAVTIATLGLGVTVSAGAASAAPQAKAKGSLFPLGEGRTGIGYAHDLKAAGGELPAHGAQAGATTGGQRLDLSKQEVVAPDFEANPPAGVDVSSWQGAINWTSVKAAGIQFAYIKATEGTTYADPDFSDNYTNAYYAGVIRGAYHFAQPGESSGAAQANFFATHGGAWSADNLTLPGMLDLEGGCYGLSAGAMQSWILDFYNTYKADTGRDIVIYTSPSWWNSCTGGWGGMAALSPLYVADWTTAADPTIPGGFPFATIWQYTDASSVSGISGAVDGDRFNGSSDRILALANNTP